MNVSEKLAAIVETHSAKLSLFKEEQRLQRKTDLLHHREMAVERTVGYISNWTPSDNYVRSIGHFVQELQNSVISLHNQLIIARDSDEALFTDEEFEALLMPKEILDFIKVMELKLSDND